MFGSWSADALVKRLSPRLMRLCAIVLTNHVRRSTTKPRTAAHRSTRRNR